MKIFELEHILGVNFETIDDEFSAVIYSKNLDLKFSLVLSEDVLDKLSEHQFLLFFNFMNQESFNDLLVNSKKVLRELAIVYCFGEYKTFDFELNSITYLGALNFEIGFYLDFGYEADNYGSWKAKFERDMLVRVEREQL
ncbi:hypothetical protein [Tenacibaculum ovolyticum]|uniref:hypothetical protein n=1 Tax=Tenacibaculum ovolyticum TaxID=104270 RepID=UPI001F264B76|nr:hypothetical protein [Tenacibaculum ovolyticum]